VGAQRLDDAGEEVREASAVTWTVRRCAGTWQMGDVYQVRELCEELIKEIVT